MYDRRVREVVRYAHGEKIRDFHIPTTVEDYRGGVSRIFERSRSAGRAGTLAVRQYVG